MLPAIHAVSMEDVIRLSRIPENEIKQNVRLQR